MIKILHTGDIHLDSPFSRLDTRRAEIRRNELRAAFTSLMTYVRINEVDILLIAGDLFDGEFVTRETVGLMIREMRKCRAEVFIAAGNHDFISPASVYAKEGVFPENVHIFSGDSLEKISLERLGVDVYGFSFTSSYMYENPIEGERVDDETKFNILLCHADTRSPDSSYCPINDDMIRSFGADYTALGHIHNAPEPRRIGNAYYAYCGCLEGRDFGEVGVKGALLIEAEKKNGIPDIRIKKLRFSKRRYENEVLYVDGAETLGEISEKIDELINERGYGEETLLSLTLRGAVSPSLVINTDTVASRVAGLFYFELADGTTPAADSESLGEDATVRGQFYRELLPLLQSENAENRRLAETALRYGLAALEGENIADF